jgi:hypothetical protein
MKKVCALIAVAVALAFGASTNASAQSSAPVITDTNNQVVQGTVVSGHWVGNGCGQSYVVYQPVYTTYYYPSRCCTTRYYYPARCSTVYYYHHSCCQPVYYSCGRRWRW